MDIVLHTFATHNDLPKHLRNTLLPLLNQQLADTFDLYSQVKQAHWNVKGMHFIQLHWLFDEIASSLIQHVDLIAERAASLGGMALGTVRMVATHSHLPEYPVSIVEGKQVIEVLVQRFVYHAATNRTAIATADLFTEVSRTIDKQLWFLEAHLQA